LFVISKKEKSMLDLDKNVGYWWLCCCVWLEMRLVLLCEKNILEFGRVVQILKENDVVEGREIEREI
jgi:hypothetical protein